MFGVSYGPLDWSATTTLYAPPGGRVVLSEMLDGFGLRLRDLERAIARLRVPHDGAAARSPARPCGSRARATRRTRTRCGSRTPAARSSTRAMRRLTPSLVEHARGADLLLAEATFALQPEMPDAIHMTARQAAGLARDAGVAPAGADAPRGRRTGRRRWPPRRPSSGAPSWPCRARRSTSERGLYRSRTRPERPVRAMRMRCRGARTPTTTFPTAGPSARPFLVLRRGKSDAWHPICRDWHGLVRGLARSVAVRAWFVTGFAWRKPRGTSPKTRGSSGDERADEGAVEPVAEDAAQAFAGRRRRLGTRSASATWWTASRSR